MSSPHDLAARSPRRPIAETGARGGVQPQPRGGNANQHQRVFLFSAILAPRGAPVMRNLSPKGFSPCT